MVLTTLAEQADTYDGIIFSDYNKGTVCPVDLPDIQRIIKACRVTVVDSKRPDHGLWHGATALCPNQHEAVSIFGIEDPAVIQRACDTEAVYITRGGRSVLLSYDHRTIVLSVREVTDPYVVGAGDAFCVGLLFALVDGWGYIRAGQRAIRFCHDYITMTPRRVS
jgi:bifunctional ADP-heptose synthase (sugar kinase/adenylyltransferase)